MPMEHDIISATKKIVLRKNAEEKSEAMETRLQSLEEKIDLILQRVLKNKKQKMEDDKGHQG